MPIIVTDYISTTGPSDTYPTHDSRLGLGGYREVDTLVERDAIPAARRRHGMLVFVVEDGKFYTLDSNLTAWSLFSDGGAQAAWVIKINTDTGFVMAARNRIMANTSTGIFTLVLPPTPAAGDTVTVADYANTFATNNLTVGRNGSNIMNLAEDISLDVDGAVVVFEYVDATKGWTLL